MYCNHTTQEHDAWRIEKDKEKAAKRYKPSEEEPVIKVIKGSCNNTDGTKKLALSQSLQAALTTTCGITPSEWNDVWASSCQETGN